MCVPGIQTQRHVSINDTWSDNCSHHALLTSSPALCPPIHLHHLQTFAQMQKGTILSQNRCPPKMKVLYVLSVMLVSGVLFGMDN